MQPQGVLADENAASLYEQASMHVPFSVNYEFEDRWEASGFLFQFQDFNPGIAMWMITVPLWAISLAAGLIPLRQLYLRLRRKRLGGFFCMNCGYDLRATPQRCPECGTAP